MFLWNRGSRSKITWCFSAVVVTATLPCKTFTNNGSTGAERVESLCSCILSLKGGR